MWSVEASLPSAKNRELERLNEAAAARQIGAALSVGASAGLVASEEGATPARSSMRLTRRCNARTGGPAG
jgi:hypothetical protein